MKISPRSSATLVLSDELHGKYCFLHVKDWRKQDTGTMRTIQKALFRNCEKNSINNPGNEAGKFVFSMPKEINLKLTALKHS